MGNSQGHSEVASVQVVLAKSWGTLRIIYERNKENPDLTEYKTDWAKCRWLTSKNARWHTQQETQKYLITQSYFQKENCADVKLAQVLWGRLGRRKKVYKGHKRKPDNIWTTPQGSIRYIKLFFVESTDIDREKTAAYTRKIVSWRSQYDDIPTSTYPFT